MKTSISELVGTTAMIIGDKGTLAMIEARLIDLGYTYCEAFDENDKNDNFADSIVILDQLEYYYCFLPQRGVEIFLNANEIEIN